MRIDEQENFVPVAQSLQVMRKAWLLIMSSTKKYILISLTTVLVIFFLTAVFFILFFLLLLFQDNFLYKHSVSTKEEVFEMLQNHQEEYESLVRKMERLISNSNKFTISLNGKYEYSKYNVKSDILKQFPVCSISVNNKDNKSKVTFHLAFPPSPNNYWGIYYKEDGLPDTWGEGKLEEVEGVYIQRGSYFIYRTERIKDNWYYFECCTR